MNRINDMLSLAAMAHKGQVDLAGVPYIFHIMRVTDNCRDMWGHKDDDLLCIAAGHDLLEDTDESYTDLLLFFGKRIANGIEALSKYKGQTYEEYQKAVFANEDAMRVKMADIKDNLNLHRYPVINQSVIDRFEKYKTFYNELSDRLEELDINSLQGII